MTDVIFPKPDDPAEVKIRIYEGWLRLPDSVVGARELKAHARKALAELQERKGQPAS